MIRACIFKHDGIAVFPPLGRRRLLGSVRLRTETFAARSEDAAGAAETWRKYGDTTEYKLLS